MKRILLFVLALTASVGMNAQMYNVREIVAADYDKAAGCEGPYRYDAPAQTPAPKGYEPFYISHYGRHGSRYAWNETTYTSIYEVLQAAEKADAFTELGKKLHDTYVEFYETPMMNTGDLSELGWEQHSNIAAAMVANFPEVFGKGSKFTARASTSQRAIVSMSAFVTSLQKHAPQVEIVGNSLHTNMLVINPPSAPRPIQQRYDRPVFPSSAEVNKNRSDHYDDILDRLFTDRAFLEDMGGRSDFLNNLFVFWSGYQNYCEDDLFEDIFTREEIVDFWEAENFRVFTSHSGNRYSDIPLLKDIVNCADEAIETGEVQGDFRFGHDNVFDAIVPLMNINGSGYIPEKGEDVKYWFQNFNCPMAANFQLVFYRSKKNPDILFKVLWNEAEATLPQLEAVSGPYYRWSDFAAWAETVYEAHPVQPATQSAAPRR